MAEAKRDEQRAPAREPRREDAFLRRALSDPRALRKRLILAIALAPPKAREKRRHR